ncbi:MAG TPA: squalene--hopene cyclase [Bacillales bacterium]|nr:squalene--hopene cyclase [Bacillales bacterium]
MKKKENVLYEINNLIDQIKRSQSSDGSWRLCFESGPMTDAYFLMILRILKHDDEELIKKLYNRLINTQQTNGAWKLFNDEEGNLSATIEAYTALLYSGHARSTDENMKKAERFVIAHGGIENAHPSTKFMLALHNLYPWPKYFPFSLFLLKMPAFFPIHFNKFSSYIRVHFAPVLILGHKKFTIQNDWTPDISKLFVTSKTGQQKRKNSLISRLQFFASKIFSNQRLLKKAEGYMLGCIEEDGTLYSYASATFYLVYALLALGYQPNSPFIFQAIEGLKLMLFHKGEDCHLQNSPSTIWDTAWLSYALQKSGVSIEDSAVSDAAKYLKGAQQLQKKEGSPLHILGGWGFSESNSCNPDIDDSQAALRAITQFSWHDLEYQKAWKTGVNWLLSMQNDDGGWGAFEKNQYRTWIGLFPIENLKDTAIDPSTPDLTGRTLEFLGKYVGMTDLHPQIQAGVKWLLDHQEENGSWFGRWGVCYLYGTWAAVTGLRAVGIDTDHPSIQRAIQWLKNAQQSDGGWGESCKSDRDRTFVPLPFSTISQTSWALDALISTSNIPSVEIDKGIDYLTKSISIPLEAYTYPTGAGLPGHFYAYYHSYNYIWPLLTLSHYKERYL